MNILLKDTSCNSLVLVMHIFNLSVRQIYLKSAKIEILSFHCNKSFIGLLHVVASSFSFL